VPQQKKNARQPKNACTEGSTYSGLLAKLPPIDLAFLDPDRPPLSVARWSIAVEESTDQEAHILDQWKSLVLEARNNFKEHQKDCLKLLCQHYGVDIGDVSAGWKLALVLAGEHVPAFQVDERWKKLERGKLRSHCA
jgi:hypothetical protein